MEEDSFSSRMITIEEQRDRGREEDNPQLTREAARSKYRNMRPGTREMRAEPGVTVAVDDGDGDEALTEAPAPRASL
jgi:ribosomal protein S2